MKPTTITVETVSTVSGTAQVMGIDATGMGTVLSILSNMYSDGSLAVVREYSSNALDAHVEAGNRDPILVTSPSHFNPVFTVQDFGTGLSRDEVLNVYAQYGASTKRDSNDQIGAFGIGAKSAFTVGTQFTVTAVKDGMITVALFALNGSGAPTVNIIDHRETMEPNGVRVDVGVRDVQGVQRAIDRLFSTWQPHTVLVDGVEPASAWTELEELAEEIHLGWRKDKYSSGEAAWTVVMGGVPYKLPTALTGSLSGRAHQLAGQVQSSLAKVYLTVPIGAVDITPSREELRVTPKTTDTVNELVVKFGGLIGPWVSGQISGAQSRIEAMIQFRKLQGRLGQIAYDTMATVTWRGQKITGNVLDIPNAEWFELRNKRGDYYGGKVASRNKELKIHPSNSVERFLFVTDVLPKRIRSVQLAAKPYLQAEARKEDKTGIVRVVALTEPAANYKNDWFDLADPALLKTDFDSFIKEWKPATTPSQRGETKYEVADSMDALTAAELTAEDTVYYLTQTEWKGLGSYRQLLTDATDDGTLVILKPTQKVEVLIKRVPEANSAWTHMGVYAQGLLSNLSQDDIDSIAAATFRSQVNGPIIDFLVGHKTKITNQVVLKVVGQSVRAEALRNNHSDQLHKIRLASRFLSKELDVASRSVLSTGDWEKVQAGLPLLISYFDRTWNRGSLGDQHVIDYINSVNL